MVIDMSAFTEAELEYLSTQRLGRLATVQPDGTLQVSPVGFHHNAELDTIDIGGYNMAASRKFRNVADNGRVAFVIDDVPSVDPWQVRCSCASRLSWTKRRSELHPSTALRAG